ncbi:hypothetical protein D7030_12335 [Flavobacteriaceae bacterium AU392]|nr:hypothetical protein D1817_06155 [Flavobacteriaceae bacterium]RKM81103.1 hypothetical protein D7030_12335 [Flavobacteriaceae bacterium AU392]
MKNTKRELVFLRTFAITTVLGLLMFTSVAFKHSGNQKFGTIDVERINIVENDGTTKMVITNASHFPTAGDSINGRIYHERKKRAGMLFFTEDGKEAGGFIYDGAKTKNGHSAGLSLTYDQYDGDQVMQLITTDSKIGDKRNKSSYLVFNDRGDKETKESMTKISKELKTITDRKERYKKYEEYRKKGLIGEVPRVALGQTAGKQNGLFLYDDSGRPRAKFIIDKENNVKLIAYDEKGNIISSWPEKK